VHRYLRNAGPIAGTVSFTEVGIRYSVTNYAVNKFSSNLHVIWLSLNLHYINIVKIGRATDPHIMLILNSKCFSNKKLLLFIFLNDLAITKNTSLKTYTYILYNTENKIIWVALTLCVSRFLRN